MPNRLRRETSPYLLQHAENPVDWFPWGEEALTKATAEDKPVFLSIGYSACHWCHVMAHESFEDEQVARVLNENFVSIKVDREERPDIDGIYMTAVQMLTGRGGWPMSVFLTPAGHPFYGGTYFPPTERYGMPSFTQVLLAVAEAWRNRRQQLLAGGRRLVDSIGSRMRTDQGHGDSTCRADTLDGAATVLRSTFDDTHAGWGGAPKFPQPMVLEFLLRYHVRTGDTRALHMATHTLDAMARGGMYDQLGGGFHRYSADARWLVPHFEKMLYDNAQLARVYLHAWQATGKQFFRTVAEETLDYALREMTDPAGGFYSTQDADSEGVEGKFFVWTPDEIGEVLDRDTEAFVSAYGVTRAGNFEGRNILEFVGDLDQRAGLADARRKLFAVREERVHPGRDEKVLTSWNGLMLAAFAEAARVLGRDDYEEAAQRNAGFLLRELRQENGRLLRTWKAPHERVLGGHREGVGKARFNGYLEDYACLIDGLLESYQTTFDPRWFVAAQELAETMIAHFSAPNAGASAGLVGFYDTSDDHETLVARPRDLQENATPSGNAMAVTALLKLAGFTNDARYVDIAHRALAQTQPMMAQYPLGFGQWLQALSYTLAQPREIAIIGVIGSADTQALLDIVRSGYRPFQVLALGVPSSEPSVVPLLLDRGLVDGRAAAYICREFTCQAPSTEPEGLRAQLAP